MNTRKSAHRRETGWLPVLLATAVMASAQTPERRTLPLQSPRQIVVSILDRRLAIVENGTIVRVFAVSVGTVSSPSPIGDFRIINRVANPTYYHTGKVISPGPDNPIGPRWVGLNLKGYGIHGTNEPRSIGKAASHGCIRLRNRDIEQFFNLVRVGDPVHIAGERDAQVAKVFAGDPETVAEVQPAGGSQNAGGQ
jgi:lipoprotein-anchoring transpeptidase ErfK/SrfK